MPQWFILTHAFCSNLSDSDLVNCICINMKVD